MSPTAGNHTKEVGNCENYYGALKESPIISRSGCSSGKANVSSCCGCYFAAHFRSEIITLKRNENCPKYLFRYCRWVYALICTSKNWIPWLYIHLSCLFCTYKYRNKVELHSRTRVPTLNHYFKSNRLRIAPLLTDIKKRMLGKLKTLS